MIAGQNGDRNGAARPLWITGLSPPDSWRSLRQPGYQQLHRARHPQHRVWGYDRKSGVSDFRLSKVCSFRLPLTLSGIVHALRNGGRWADCPREVYGPKKTLYNRFVRWAERGIWERIFNALAGGEDVPDRLFIDSTCIKVHRCAGGGKGGPWPMASAAPRGVATPSSTLSAMRKAGPSSCS